MKLIDTIIFSICVALFIIGIHQTMVLGLTHSYWIFMVSLGLLFWYQLRKKKEDPETETKKRKK